eukprot:m.915961 g.915961  ORF g.915961 m.915961 type:complete len:357 (-) comp23734_c0_seq11:377-1447(-)
MRMCERIGANRHTGVVVHPPATVVSGVRWGSVLSLWGAVGLVVGQCAARTGRGAAAAASQGHRAQQAVERVRLARCSHHALCRLPGARGSGLDGHGHALSRRRQLERQADAFGLATQVLFQVAHVGHADEAAVAARRIDHLLHVAGSIRIDADGDQGQVVVGHAGVCDALAQVVSAGGARVVFAVGDDNLMVRQRWRPGAAIAAGLLPLVHTVQLIHTLADGIPQRRAAAITVVCTHVVPVLGRVNLAARHGVVQVAHIGVERAESEQIRRLHHAHDVLHPPDGCVDRCAQHGGTRVDGNHKSKLLLLSACLHPKLSVGSHAVVEPCTYPRAAATASARNLAMLLLLLLTTSPAGL